MANHGNASVTELSASTGALVQVISGASYDFDGMGDLVSDGAHVWVEGGSSIAELDASTGALVRLIGGLGTNTVDNMSTDGAHLWVGEDPGSVTEISTATGAVVKVIGGSVDHMDSPGAVASDGHDVWVANVDGSVTELNAATGTLVRVIPGGGPGVESSEAISADGTHLWLASSADGSGLRSPAPSLTELSASTGEVVREFTGLDVFYQPSDVVSDGQDVWVVNSKTMVGHGSLVELSALTGDVVRVVYSASHGLYLPQDLALDGGSIWLTNPHVNLVSEVYELNGSNRAGDLRPQVHVAAALRHRCRWGRRVGDQLRGQLGYRDKRLDRGSGPGHVRPCL